MNILNRLKEQTSKIHSTAEEHPLMVSFANGSFKKEHLLSYLVNLRPVYEVIEQKLLIPYIHNNFDLCRSRLVSKDIAKLYTELKDGLDIGIFKIHPCTVSWLTNQWNSSDQLVSDLYVRWLADLYGGRKLVNTLFPYSTHLIFQDNLQAITEVRNIILEHSNNIELKNTFFNYACSDLDNKQELIVCRAVEFFKYHIELFDRIYEM